MAARTPPRFLIGLPVLALLGLITGSVPTATASDAAGSCGAEPGAAQAQRPTAAAGDAQPGFDALAVVYRREGGRSVLLGSAPLPADALTRLDGEQDAGPARRELGDPSHEIYILPDGQTRAFSYWEAAGSFAAVREEGERETDVRQDRDGMLSAVVKAAVNPPLDTHEPVADVVAQGLFGGSGPTDLASLSARSDMIARGRVAGVVRQAFIPYNATGPLQHTVYAFAVQEYFKAAPPEGRPVWPVLKVRQYHGSLPWVVTLPDQEIRGTGFRVSGVPPLSVGADYILFLYIPEPEIDRHRGYRVGGSGSVYGKIGDLDEYVLTAPWRGAALVRDGYTWSPDGDGAPFTRPLPSEQVFVSGPEILGQPLGTAERLIRETLAAPR